MDPISWLAVGVPIAIAGYLGLSRAGRAGRHVELGDVYRLLRRYEDAVRAYSEALRLDPANPIRHQILCARALCLAHLDRFSEALEDVAQSLQMEPTQEAYMARSTIYRLARDERLAREDADRAVALRPTAAAYLHRAAVLQAFDRLAEAAADCTAALAQKETVEAYLWRAQCYLRDGQADLALQDAMAAAQKSRDPAVCVLRARCYEALGQTTDALQDLDRAIRRGSVEALYHKGMLLIAEGRLDDALKSLEKAWRRHPGFAEALNGIAIVHGLQEQFEKAVHYYQKALEIEPDSALYRSNLAEDLYYLGRLDEAEDIARRAIKLNPELPSIYSVLALISLEKQAYDEALGRADVALELDPEQGYPHEVKARALEALGRPAEAIESYRRFVEVASRATLFENRLRERIDRARDRIRALQT
ncbi:MAG: tetratricopeptide repeat protein [Armatimonadetes bacterium]|nr:tetratricopeptide repeat protein [Armatimonadota bacterium]